MAGRGGARPGSGGARPGSGRKRTRDVFELPVRRAEKRIADRLPELIDNMFILAEGVKVEETTTTGAPPVVYTRAPDRAANEYLINRILGKPTEKVEQDLNVTQRQRIEVRTVTIISPVLPEPSDAER